MSVYAGLIKIDENIQVGLDAGCPYSPSCLSCPHPVCYIDLSQSEQRQFSKTHPADHVNRPPIQKRLKRYLR